MMLDYVGSIAKGSDLHGNVKKYLSILFQTLKKPTRSDKTVEIYKSIVRTAIDYPKISRNLNFTTLDIGSTQLPLKWFMFC